jgi:hypothetical protein
MSPVRLPRLDGITLRVMQAGKTAVGIMVGVHFDRDTHRTKRRRCRIEVPGAKVNLPQSLGIDEVVACLGERTQGNLSKQERHQRPRVTPVSIVLSAKRLLQDILFEARFSQIGEH